MLGLRGQGTYGAVYRAEKVGEENLGPAALKLGLYAQDPRFEREAELLTRISHPSVPRLLDRGHWQDSRGNVYPYIAMEWVEGEPLYEWAQRTNPSSLEVIRLLAQIARALAATHAVGVHRDVKGDNMLVRLPDQRAMLMDFGSGHYRDARPLTPPPFPPGTPAYRSPEAWQFSLASRRLPPVPYAPGPADDIFALGVTAYRLVTREYLPPLEPRQDEAGLWHLEVAEPRPPLELNPRVAPQLSALILRMLATSPDTRGTASELAADLERALDPAGPEANVRLYSEEMRASSQETREAAAIAAPIGPHLQPEFLGNKARLRPMRPRPRSRTRAAKNRGAHRHGTPEHHKPQAWAPRLRPLLVATALMVVLFLCAHGSNGPRLVEEPAVAQFEPSPQKRDAGSAGVGDTMTALESSIGAPTGRNVVALDMPQKPLPGQSRPDRNGRCPSAMQVAINGGCWFNVNVDLDACNDGYVYKSKCYAPVFPPQRQPTSTPPSPR